MFQDKTYWEKYYNRKSSIDIGFNNPSGFAKFIIEFLDNSHTNIIELGCGNGRDSIFFAENGKTVFAVDQCENTVFELNKIYKNLSAGTDDFTNMPIDLELKPDAIYSRFTMHSVDEEGENRTIDWASQVLQPGGLFLLEARTVLDPLCGQGDNRGRNVWYTDHYRRFVIANEILEKFKNKGFEILFSLEQNNLAVYKDDNPTVLRMIAKKI